MNDINSITLIGRITKDAEMKYTSGGTAISTFSLANNRKYKETESVSYFNCQIWGKVAEALTQYLTKGKRIGVQGRAEEQRWDDKETGKPRSKVVINVESIQFLDSKKADGTAPQGEEPLFDENSVPF